MIGCKRSSFAKLSGREEQELVRKHQQWESLKRNKANKCDTFKKRICNKMWKCILVSAKRHFALVSLSKTTFEMLPILNTRISMLNVRQGA